MDPFIIILIIIAVFLFWGILTYNDLIKTKNQTQEAWSDIEIQLKRRYDLIPNLLETVKGYASHEKEVFEKVAEARSRAMDAKTMKERSEAENFLSSTLKSLFAVSENYPELKASQNFLELQRELRDTEDKVQAARRFYNSLARDMNIKIESVPTNLIAKMFNFKKMELFEIDQPQVKEAPKIKF